MITKQLLDKSLKIILLRFQIKVIDFYVLGELPNVTFLLVLMVV